MKFQKILIAGVLVSGMLAGCNSAEDISGSNEPKEEAKQAAQEPKSQEVKKDENGNYILEEVGQIVDTGDHKAELMKIREVNETVDIAPLKVTVQDIKVIKMSDISEESLIDFAYMVGEEEAAIKDGFSYIQVKYTAENTSDQNIEWYDIMNVVTDKGQQIDAQMDDFIYSDEEGSSEFIGKVKKEFTDGYLLKDEDINKVKLIFGYTMNADNYEDITPEQTVEYELN